MAYLFRACLQYYLLLFCFIILRCGPYIHRPILISCCNCLSSVLGHSVNQLTNTGFNNYKEGLLSSQSKFILNNPSSVSGRTVVAFCGLLRNVKLHRFYYLLGGILTCYWDGKTYHETGCQRFQYCRHNIFLTVLINIDKCRIGEILASSSHYIVLYESSHATV